MQNPRTPGSVIRNNSGAKQTSGTNWMDISMPGNELNTLPNERVGAASDSRTKCCRMFEIRTYVTSPFHGNMAYPLRTKKTLFYHCAHVRGNTAAMYFATLRLTCSVCNAQERREVPPWGAATASAKSTVCDGTFARPPTRVWWLQAYGTLYFCVCGFSAEKAAMFRIFGKFETHVGLTTLWCDWLHVPLDHRSIMHKMLPLWNRKPYDWNIPTVPSYRSA